MAQRLPAGRRLQTGLSGRVERVLQHVQVIRLEHLRCKSN